MPNAAVGRRRPSASATFLAKPHATSLPTSPSMFGNYSGMKGGVPLTWGKLVQSIDLEGPLTVPATAENSDSEESESDQRDSLRPGRMCATKSASMGEAPCRIGIREQEFTNENPGLPPPLPLEGRVGAGAVGPENEQKEKKNWKLQKLSDAFDFFTSRAYKRRSDPIPSGSQQASLGIPQLRISKSEQDLSDASLNTLSPVKFSTRLFKRISGSNKQYAAAGKLSDALEQLTTDDVITSGGTVGSARCSPTSGGAKRTILRSVSMVASCPPASHNIDDVDEMVRDRWNVQDWDDFETACHFRFRLLRKQLRCSGDIYTALG